ncbi:hypothetical protein [Actinoplanes sp. L3-i22]|uniref:hypothetical protein n=1 Tax=Actinoplanes sp. L3-i22 TaxID=2836373 RepID=UPI001C773BE4|nr:hypothetical protein [Actinoplanes sp. L3-i22]BCY11136.1 hypothetical protein L3i22_062240 [Actinoplanes sp. L3-i22]
MAGFWDGGVEMGKDRGVAEGTKARAVLATGGGFTTAVATVLGICGRYELGDRALLYGLGATCFITALTMLTAAAIDRA